MLIRESARGGNFDSWAEAFFYSVCVLGGLGAFSALVIGWVAMRFIRFEENSMEEQGEIQ